MTENDTTTAVDFEPISFWFDKLGVARGDTVMIVPAGNVGGQGFQGTLQDIIFVNSLPFLILITNAVNPTPVAVRWDAVCMVTKVQTPEVDKEVLERIQREFEEETGLSPDDVERGAAEAAFVADATRELDAITTPETDTETARR